MPTPAAAGIAALGGSDVAPDLRRRVAPITPLTSRHALHEGYLSGTSAGANQGSET